MLFHDDASALRICPENIGTVQMIPKDLLTPLAVKYIRLTLINGGAIVTLRRGREYLSLAVMEFVGNDLAFTQIVTAPQHRGKGYAGELLHRLLGVTDPKKMISASLNTAFESYPAAKKLLLREGFQLGSGYTTYVAGLEDAHADGGKENFGMVHRLWKRAAAEGFSLVPFSGAEEALLKQIEDSHTNAFENTLNPKTLFSTPGYIKMDHSFVLFREGEVAAYSIVSERDPGTAEFDQLAAAKKYRTAGLAVFPAVASVEKVMEEGKYRKFMWQIVDGNIDSSDTVAQLFPGKKAEMKLESYRLPPRSGTK